MEEQKTQTFAEWLLDYMSTHRDAVVSIEQGQWGTISLQIRDYSKSRSGVAANCAITHQLYKASKLSFDEILIDAAEELCKEIENYGN
jgi:hypothetical protein